VAVTQKALDLFAVFDPRIFEMQAAADTLIGYDLAQGHMWCAAGMTVNGSVWILHLLSPVGNENFPGHPTDGIPGFY